MIRISYLLPLFILFSCSGHVTTGDSESYHDSGLSKTEFFATRGDSVFFYGPLQDVISKFESSTPVNRRMTETGMAFLGKPYVASTLEKEGEEQLEENHLFIEEMSDVEKEMSSYDMRYITKDLIDKKSPGIMEGDF